MQMGAPTISRSLRNGWETDTDRTSLGTGATSESGPMLAQGSAFSKPALVPVTGATGAFCIGAD
jgi:hypothetical protein